MFRKTITIEKKQKKEFCYFSSKTRKISAVNFKAEIYMKYW